MKREWMLVALVAIPLLPALAIANDAAWDGRFGAAGLSAPAHAIVVAGNTVYVGGSFTTAGGALARRIATWNNASWSELGGGVSGDVYAIAIDGSNVYVGGAFTTAGGTAANRIARWNGSTWSALGIGVSDDVRAIAVSGGNVYAGGIFTSAGGTAALRIARWDGANWSALGVGVSDDVYAIAVDGSDVYVGGAFTAAGGAGASRVARWNGSSWSALDSGVSGTVNAIAMGGGDVYVGGDFTTAGGGAASRIARWNGSSWSALGAGVSGIVNAVAVDGSDIYAAGDFTTAGGSAALRIAKWNGTSWSNLGSGVSDIPYAIGAAGGDMYTGGEFTVAGGKTSLYFGRYNPLIVTILITGFDASTDASGVTLWWRIFADEDVTGFRVYRREPGMVSYDRIDASNSLSTSARSYLDSNIEFGKSYQYVLGVVRPDGSEVLSPSVDVTTTPRPLTLAQNFPNPFTRATEITFTLPEPSRASLDIVDVRGKRVATIVDDTVDGGTRRVTWDGKNAAGNAVSAGVYFYRLRVGNQTITRRMVLVR